MKEATGVVEKGQVKLPPSVQIPEGATVRVLWDETDLPRSAIEREPLSAEDVQAEIRWATGQRFAR